MCDILGQHSVALAHTVASQQAGPGFESASAVRSLRVLLILAWVFLQVHQRHALGGVRFIGDSTQPVERECEWSSVFLCSPCDRLATCAGCTSGIRLQPPCVSEKDKQMKMNGYDILIIAL